MFWRKPKQTREIETPAQFKNALKFGADLLGPWEEIENERRQLYNRKQELEQQVLEAGGIGNLSYPEYASLLDSTYLYGECKESPIRRHVIVRRLGNPTGTKYPCVFCGEEK